MSGRSIQHVACFCCMLTLEYTLHLLLEDGFLIRQLIACIKRNVSNIRLAFPQWPKYQEIASFISVVDCLFIVLAFLWNLTFVSPYGSVEVSQQPLLFTMKFISFKEFATDWWTSWIFQLFMILYFIFFIEKKI